MTLTAAVAQFAPGGDKAVNLASIERMIRDAARRAARLVVLPEYATFTVRTVDERFVDTAEPLDGPTVSRIAAVAAELNVAVIVGVNEVAGNGHIHNTLVGIDAGEVRAVYRKVHLYDAFGYKESDRVVAGEPVAPQLLAIDGFTIGMQTCYDVRFPETSRVLVDAGADVIAMPAQWVPGPLKEYHWNTLVRARAIENTVYVVAAGQTGPAGAGNSVIVDPMGIAVAALGEAPGLSAAVLERERVDEVRAMNPALQLRRYRVAPGSA